MPATFTYPGVYVEEIPSPVHPIMGVTTSVAAFVDVFAAGPINMPVQINSLADFARTFGGIDPSSEASYAIRQFFLNGGQTAWVVRVAPGVQVQPGAAAALPAPNPAIPPPLATAQLTLQEGSPPQQILTVQAANPGSWGKNIQVAAADVPGGKDTAGNETFNLYVRRVDDQGNVVQTETFRNLSMTPTDSQFVVDVVNHQSALVQVLDAGLGHVPFGVDVTPSGQVPQGVPFQSLVGGTDLSGPPASADLANALVDPNGVNGIYTLNQIEPFIFNILCLPAASKLDPGNMKAVLDDAAAYCKAKRAMLIVDIPESVQTPAQMTAWLNDAQNAVQATDSAAVYFPRLQVMDPFTGRPRSVGACGTIAGIWARTDATRGVWKAPAGTEATILGATLETRLNDADNGELNPQGINVLRNFPIFGNVVWGSRTLLGADQQASEWKYIPVRRTADYIEESLYQGLKWVVFEPNDEPLWAQIRLNVGAFMHDLFRQGAFQGTTPRDAYFVKCDKDTTTQNDIDKGIVNIVVGFAPLKPAEFVVIQLQQITGDIQT